MNHLGRETVAEVALAVVACRSGTDSEGTFGCCCHSDLVARAEGAVCTGSHYGSQND